MASGVSCPQGVSALAAWSAADSAAIAIDPYRRNLQRAYVDTLRDRIRARDTAPGDARALFKGELRALDREIRAALARKPERMTALHLEDVRDQIARALDPKMEGTGAAPAPAAGQRPADAAGLFNDDLVDDASDVGSVACDGSVRRGSRLLGTTTASVVMS